MYNNIPTKVLTGEVRLSYVNLVAPRVNNNDPTATPKYSVTLLIPKTDTAVKANIDASIEAAAKDAQAKIWAHIVFLSLRRIPSAKAFYSPDHLTRCL